MYKLGDFSSTWLNVQRSYNPDTHLSVMKEGQYDHSFESDIYSFSSVLQYMKNFSSLTCVARYSSDILLKRVMSDDSTEWSLAPEVRECLQKVLTTSSAIDASQSACIQLFSFPDPLNSEECKEQENQEDNLRIEMNEEALSLLEERLKHCERLIPVVVIGNSQCGKSHILDRIAGCHDKTPFGSYNEFNGAIAYPFPIQTGSSELLLIEMSGIDFDDEECKGNLLARKMLHALLSVASVCIICLEKRSMFTYITEIMQIYEDMHQHSKLALSKFFIRVETKKALSQKPLANGYREFSRGPFMDMCEFFYRGNSGFDDDEFLRMIGMIDQKDFHREFEATHIKCQPSLNESSLQECPSMIQKLTNILQILGELANNDTTVEEFISSAPDFTIDCAVQIAEIKRMFSTSCVQLVYFSPPRGLQESHEAYARNEELRIELDTDALGLLSQQFSVCENLIPILVIGNPQSGKSSILDKIIKQTIRRPFASFKALTGVVVFPEPVQIGRHQLLLMEMSGLNSQAESKGSLLMKKMLHAFLAVTSVCIVCLNNTTTLEDINEIIQIYKGMKAKSSLALSKFFLCAESPEKSRERGFTLFSDGDFKNLCEFFYRGSSDFDDDEFLRMIDMIAQEDFHSEFEATHTEYQQNLNESSLQECPSMIQKLIIILQILGKLANNDFTLDTHIANSPNFALDSTVQTGKMQELEKVIDCISHLEALLFFKRVGFHIDIDTETLAKLQANYKETEPLAVVTFFGHQGKGKSTLINSIIQHLLGIRLRKMICQEGNTTGHTTIGSYVLSHPLKLPTSMSQLMFVDLEGLQASETLDESEESIQQNLIYSILAITSVYCILVSNEASSIKFVEEQLEQIKNLQTTFQFTVERVFLLFHDKNLDCEPNQEWMEKVNSWNQLYFRQNEVIIILNKPCFKDQENAQMIQEFLKRFLSDIDYPKKQQNGNLMDMFQMISYVSLISKSLEPDISKLGLTEEQVITKEKVIKEKRAEINAAFANARCENDSISLDEVFTRETDAIIKQTMSIPELGSERSTLKRHITAALNTAIQTNRIQLILVEKFYQSIRRHTTYELKEEILKYNFFAQVGWSFISMMNKLHEKYKVVNSHYPNMKEPDVNELIEFLKDLNTKMKVSGGLLLGTDVLFTVATLGIGTFSCGIVRIVRKLVTGQDITVSSILAPGIASEIAAPIVNSLVHIRSSVANFWKAERDFWTSAPGRAYALYDKNLQVNLPQQLDIESLDSTMGAVLLVVGKQEMNIARFLNKFIKMTFVMKANCQNSFNNSDPIQGLMFPKIKCEIGEPNRFGVIIYISMESNLRNEKARRLAMLTAALMTKSSWTYFFCEDAAEADIMMTDIITAYQPQDSKRAVVITRIKEGGYISPSLHMKFRAKKIDIELEQMDISNKDTKRKILCSNLTKNFFNASEITILELRNVLTQGRVYLEQAALQIFENQTKSKEFIQILTDLQLSENINLVLVVGRKGMGIHHFLSNFMKWIFPLRGDYKDIFNDTNRFQAHHFCQLDQQSARHGVLIYVRMKKKAASSKAVKLATIAAMFLAKSTLTLFFLKSIEEPHTDLSSITAVYQPQSLNTRHAWIIVPADSEGNIRSVTNMCLQKLIVPSFLSMDISMAGGNFTKHFPDLITELSTNKLITPQEVKDIVTQAQRFYINEPAVDLQQGEAFSSFFSTESTASLKELELPEEMGILLMIGRKNMGVEDVASRFIYSISGQNCLKFTNTTPIQARTVLVKWVNQDNQQTFRQIIVLYITMEGTDDGRLAVYAATLLSKVALTCFFFDSCEHPDAFLENILNVYQPNSEAERKVCVYAFHHDNAENVKRRLEDQFLYFNSLEAETLLSSQPMTPQECQALLVEADRFYTNEPATALYKENVSSISYQINNDFSKLIKGFSPQEKLVTLIAVGWKNKQISHFLNSFMLWNYSVSDLHCMIFNERIRIQAVCFNLCESNSETQTSFSKLLMIYIRMKGKTCKLKNKVLSELAKALVSISVLHCFFLNSAKERHEAITDILRDREGEQSIPWVIVPPSTETADLETYFSAETIPVHVQPMNILEGAHACKAQLLQLKADLLKLKPLSPMDLITALEDAIEKANRTS